MSRNASGTYSLPNVAVVTGTTITASDENTTRSDIATELTDSLSRSGKGGMLSGKQLILDTGGVAAPAIAFLTDTGSGFYRIGLNDIGFAINGVKVMEWTASATTIVQPLSCSGTANVVGNFSVATNKFNVTAASGNTAVAGTFAVTGVTTLTGAATFTGGFTVGAAVTISAGSNKITNVTDPASAQDAATKNYVDTTLAPIARGSRAWARLDCGAAGAVTVTNGSNVASASYATNALTVNFTAAIPSVNNTVVANTANASQVKQVLRTSGSATTFCTVFSKDGTTGNSLNFANGDIVYVVVFDV